MSLNPKVTCSDGVCRMSAEHTKAMQPEPVSATPKQLLEALATVIAMESKCLPPSMALLQVCKPGEHNDPHEGIVDARK